MKPVVRNILAVIGGILIGSVINMGIIFLGFALIELPEGVDMNHMDPESLRKALPHFEAKHFITPFLAHGLGTLVGAMSAYLIAGSRKMLFAWIIGGWFLIGGIANVFMLPAPLWYNVVDLLGAYFPMAWIGGMIGKKFSRP